MATVNPVVTPVMGLGDIDGWQVIWPAMHNGDVGAPVGTTIGLGATAQAPSGGHALAGFADKTIQVVGTFGAGGSVAAEGSNDAGANWFALSDPLGNVITLTQAAMKEITEAVIWLRPHVTAGDGTTSLTITMFLRKTHQ